jgi:hypothetical protein
MADSARMLIRPMWMLIHTIKNKKQIKV